ncbi:MAG: FAD-dependent oxidoreductase [Sedimentisphaerales bacterium]|jgi:NADPH-dependent 2,4-dienoyl-CoA reductase/sulfur reductase-like enzyme/rhodanese-related sulfurtransferase/two-component sensor histidine kinase|nr:FAD-dependent oxidoreductase [Sedimentisphaerales bacterium]
MEEDTDNKPDQSEILQFASLIAHQLKSPISTISTLLDVLATEVAGPLTPKQKDLIARANLRCDEGVATVRRMLAIVSALGRQEHIDGVVDVAGIVRNIRTRYEEKAIEYGLTFVVQAEDEPVYVHGTEPALTEALDALIDNAFKYTPSHGQVRLTLTAEPPNRLIHLCVADSGVGIPEGMREKIFEPFHRTASARSSTRGGVGLGLSFVKAVVEALGGAVQAGKADLGGARLDIQLPMADPSEIDSLTDNDRSSAMKVVIVGGVAAGPKVAAKVIRLMPHASVTVVEKGQFLSYAGCGLPYYISGQVKNHAELMSTPMGALRDAVFFQKVKNVRILSRTEATKIDRAARSVRVKELGSRREFDLEYDKLVLATGASPIRPSIPGHDLDNIFCLHGVQDAEGIKAGLAGDRARDVVIVGGGLIGMETTEALARSGCRVTIVEMQPQTLGILDAEMARLVELHLESNGVKVLTNTKVCAFEGDGKVHRVVTDRGTLATDLVIMGIGVRPNTALASAAGLEIGETGGIKVNEHMRTSDPDIYAAGDCVECTDILTGRPAYVPLGSTANKQGRVAAVNLCGGEDTFPGILGSTICKVFDYCVARTGLTERAARDLGYTVTTALAPAPDRANYLSTARLLLLKLVVDRDTRRLLGVQAVGPGAGDKRIDVAATAIAAGMTVDQVAGLDLGYAPPYSPAMDNLITAANVARNKLDGHMVGVCAAEVHQMLQDRKDFVFLDVRTPGEHDQVRLPGATLIPLATLRGRIEEIPKGKPIVTFAQISLRGYEAALILRASGFEDVRVLDGGIAMWPYEKLQ